MKRWSSLDVVVPVYRGEQFLAELTARILSICERLNLRVSLIFVCDASPDGSWDEITRLAEIHSEVCGLMFTRNRGQHTAVLAGIDYAASDLVAVMDCDLQDAPEDLEYLLGALSSQTKVAAAAPPARGNATLRYRILRRIYHQMHQLVNDQSTDMRSLSFILMTQEVAQMLRNYREADRHFSGFLLDAGYSIAFVPTAFRRRPDRFSSYTFSKRVRLAISGLLFHSTFWIGLAIAVGLLLSAGSFVTGFGLVGARLSGAMFEAGWTSIFVLVLFTLGLTMFGLGILGLYINQVLHEVRRRPLYVLDATVNSPTVAEIDY